MATRQPGRPSTAASRWEHPVEARLRQAVARCFSLDESSLRPEATLRGELARAGVDIGTLDTLLRSQFDVDLPAWAFERIRTYGDLARTVRVVLWAREVRRAA